MQTKRIITSIYATAMLFWTAAPVFPADVEIGDWYDILLSIRDRFPTVQQIQPSTLNSWLSDSDRRQPILLDIRSKAEFEVSHIRNAVHVAPNTRVSQLKIPAGEDDPIVLYCSVGYRSSAFVQKLQQAGYTQVYNLEGSIFGWANRGYPVFRGQQLVSTVHPYDAAWGRFLKKQYQYNPNQKTIHKDDQH